MTRVVNKIRRELLLGGFLLLIPFTASYFFVVPNYQAFITTGDVVSVSKLGIKGSVYFVYVHSGYTNNLFQKYSLWFNHKDIEFHNVDQEEVEEQDEELEYEADIRDDTVRTAFSAAKPTEETSPATDDKMNTVLKNAQRYYGDSFGLMVAIGLTEEWSKADFSKGEHYKIAGTGTITDDKQVGPVGGIRYKVISANQKGMQFFFVSDSSEVSYESGLTNKEEALQTVQEKHMKLKVIPVASLDEAIQFLKSLK